jgi:NAD(P)-dependent dehydrogenase (short-subunit alcohol dehydrogenase family)
MPAQKIALVTGGSRGLGKEMALALARNGADVILTYNTQSDAADATVTEIRNMSRKAAALPLDMRQMSALNPFISSLRETLQTHWDDYLVNNAGVGATLPIADVTEEAFDNLLNIHFKGVYFLTQKCMPLLNNGGSIINISTGTTRVCVHGYSVYSSLKSAVETFTKYLAKELGVRGIRANVVAPGPIETDFNNAAIRNNPQAKQFLASQTALGRVGNADDVGGVVAFLCSDDARWINAQRIEVAGGMFL